MNPKLSKETTYQRYKRENLEMKSILSVDVQNFILGKKDFQERLNYLIKCMETFRQQDNKT